METPESLALGIPIAAAAIAWFYQKAIERQERRIARYEKILELANSLLRAGRNPDHLDQILTEIRKLRLSGPRRIVEASSKFREATDTGASSEVVEQAFFEFVQAMRRDCSIQAALWPQIRWGALRASDVKLMVARRD